MSCLNPTSSRVVQVFDYFEERTPESRVSRCECTIRWSYAAADHALGARHAALLVEHLEKVLVSAPVEMVWEATFVEVRPYGTSMGFGLLQLLDADYAARTPEEDLQRAGKVVRSVFMISIRKKTV